MWGCGTAGVTTRRPIRIETWSVFDSIQEAASTFAARADFDPFYPCVDDAAAELHVYIGREYHDNGPDRIVRFGRRGGVRIERA